jgi:hypothetical protein
MEARHLLDTSALRTLPGTILREHTVYTSPYCAWELLQVSNYFPFHGFANGAQGMRTAAPSISPSFRHLKASLASEASARNGLINSGPDKR